MEALFCGYAVLSFLWDVRKKLLPNRLVAISACAAGVLHLWQGGWSGLAICAVGAVAGVAITIPLWAIGAIGAGDAKWFFAAGAWVGGANAGTILLFAVFISALAAALRLVISERFRRRWQAFCVMAASCVYAPSTNALLRSIRNFAGQGYRFPFMVAVLPSIGFMFALRCWPPVWLEGWV
jgi:Flp pilus assembly protein protease CpaA